MKKKYIVRKNAEFNNIINVGYNFRSNIFNINVLKNNLTYNRYGVAISTKIGNAVTRNKYKRQIKDIIDDININFSGYDVIIIARLNIKNCEYIDIKEDIVKLISKIGEKYEK